MGGLFDTFSIAERGLNVSQGEINTTSHNISNANTDGYSRQRAVAQTTEPQGGNSKFDSLSVGQVGTGAEITSIQRIRDTFLDYQVRNEMGVSGYYTSTSDSLSKVEDVFGEPSDSGIQELTSQFFNSFQEVAKTPDQTDVKTVAVQDASSLADALNYAYNQLQQNSQDSQSLLQSNVTDVNSYLDQINELNKQIKYVSSLGQTPNDLMDKRDNLVDTLSNEFGIKIDNDKDNTINLSSTEYQNSDLVKSDPADPTYSRLSYVKDATLGTDASGNSTVTVEYYPLGNENAPTQSFTVSGGNQQLVDSLMQNRILIADKNGIVGTTTTTTDASGNTTINTTPPTNATDLNAKIFQTYQYESGVNTVDNNSVKGEIAANQSVQATINGYMNSLDRLAAGLAYAVNAIQTGSTDGSTASQGLQNNLIFTNSGNTAYTLTSTDITNLQNELNNTTTPPSAERAAELNTLIAAGAGSSAYKTQNGTITTSADTGITAANIKVNSDLANDPTLLNCNTTSTSGEGDGARANAIANLNALKMNYTNVSDTEDLTQMDRTTFLNQVGISGFKDSSSLELNAGTDGSTADSYYKTIINNLAVNSQEASKQVDNQQTILGNLQDQRSSISGVSLDEEMTNLIQFQHAYQANAKVISTVDQLLDVVINGLMKD
jgi:flagellar hook-associated protein 1 FlgK